ncbi:MAG TPA: hypothetical protein EYP93_04830 [Gammaproteobacteria bacterium]|nr:hypothetical protein [Gammaproteobacteria bacterium]
MYLFEYQAKDLMRQWGIPVLPGSVAITGVQAREVAQELGCGPWAVKAQIYAGGRAQGSFSDAPRSGGIRFSDSLDDVHFDVGRNPGYPADGGRWSMRQRGIH